MYKLKKKNTLLLFLSSLKERKHRNKIEKEKKMYKHKKSMRKNVNLQSCLLIFAVDTKKYSYRGVWRGGRRKTFIIFGSLASCRPENNINIYKVKYIFEAKR